jgi:hypothetical protein
MRAKLTLTGIATAGLLAAGLSIGSPAAFADSIPADCTLYVYGTTASLTCTHRPPAQVWNLSVTCKVPMVTFIREQASEVTGDGVSSISNCNAAGSPIFVIDS